MIVRQLTRWAWAAFLCLGLGACQTVPSGVLPQHFDAAVVSADGVDGIRLHDHVSKVKVAVYSCNTPLVYVLSKKQDIGITRYQRLFFEMESMDLIDIRTLYKTYNNIINIRIQNNYENITYILSENNVEILKIDRLHGVNSQHFFEISGVYLILADSSDSIWSRLSVADVCRPTRSTPKAVAGAARTAAFAEDLNKRVSIESERASFKIGVSYAASGSSDPRIYESSLKYKETAPFGRWRAAGSYVFKEDDPVVFQNVHLNEDGRWCIKRTYLERVWRSEECPTPVRVTSSAGMQPFSVEYAARRTSIIFLTTTDFYLLPQEILRTLRFEGALMRGCTYDTARKYKIFERRREILVVSCDDTAKTGRSPSSPQAPLPPAVPATD